MATTGPTGDPAKERASTQEASTHEAPAGFEGSACGCGQAQPVGDGLVVGAPDGPAEREADRAAALVSSGAAVRPAIRPGGVRAMQRVPSNGGPADPGSDFASRLDAMRGAGSPLPEDQRVALERSFGRSFGGVRVHTDGSAAAASLAVQAHAFTTGNDIFFAPGRFAPATPAGRRLLAHELAHVAQQRDVVQRKCTSCADEDEVVQRQPLTQPIVSDGARGPAIVDDVAQVGPGQMTRAAFR